jgi:hypothetical protein
MANQLRLLKPTEVWQKPITQLGLDGKKKPVDLRHYQYLNKKLTINEIETYATQLRENFLKKDVNASVEVIIETPEGHRQGRFNSIKDNKIHIWNPTDYNYDVLNKQATNNIKWYDNGKAVPREFWFNVLFSSNKGGADEHNDCLYNSLFKVVPKQVLKIWDFPEKLKKFLEKRGYDVQRDSMINAGEHMDDIERKLNVQLFITGDVERAPKINAKTVVHLVLENSHYKLLPSSKPKVKGISFKERQPMTYNYSHQHDNYMLYDGKHKFINTTDYVREMQKTPMSCPYILIKVATKDDLKSEYNTFIEQADKLKELTSGLVNMYKTGNDKATALYLFNHYTKHITEADTIKQIEGNFILRCYRGGLLYSTPYRGIAYLYDFKSKYPAIMNSKMTFPYKEGTFQVLTNEDIQLWLENGKQYFKYGIYRAVVSGNIHKALFKENTDNYYTHIDLETAHKEGYTIELIQDGSSNFLWYPNSTRISGTQLFKAFVETLYPIKQGHKDVHTAKEILNILWGALAEKKKYEIYTTLEDNTEIVIGMNDEIHSIKMLGRGKMMLKVVDRTDAFVSGFARIAPFITAQGRKMIADIIRDNVDVDCVKRIHTDSILSSVPLNGEFKNKADALLGELGYEGYCEDCEVVNMGKPKGVFVM